MNEQADRDKITELAADIVSAYVSNNPVPTGDLAQLIGHIHTSLSKLTGGETEAPPLPQKPAVPIKKSVTDDYIVCLEDGKKFKSLKRHLREQFGLTPDEYRRKWKLPDDYPMVAPSYAAARSQLARAIGLGRRSPAKPTRAPGKVARR